MGNSLTQAIDSAFERRSKRLGGNGRASSSPELDPIETAFQKRAKRIHAQAAAAIPPEQLQAETQQQLQASLPQPEETGIVTKLAAKTTAPFGTTKPPKPGEAPYVDPRVRAVAETRKDIVPTPDEKQAGDEEAKQRLVKLGEARLFARDVSRRIEEQVAAHKPVKQTRTSTRGQQVPVEDPELRRFETAKKVLARVDAMNPENVGFLQGLKRATNEPEKLLPFVGSLVEGGELLDVLLTSLREERGDKLTPGEDALLDSYAAFIQAGQNFSPGILDRAAEVAVSIPAFALEFAATSGVYGTAKEGATKLLEKLAKRKVTEKLLGTAAGRLTGKAVTAGVGGAAQATVLPGFPVETVRRQIPKLSVGLDKTTGNLARSVDAKGEDFVEALTKAYGLSAVEAISERTGGLVQQPLEALKKQVLARWVRQKGGETATDTMLTKLAERAGWNGIIGEVFEEQVAKPFRSAIEGGPLTEDFTLENLAVESLGFALFGGAAKGLGYGVGKAGELAENRLKKQFPEQATEPETKPTAKPVTPSKQAAPKETKQETKPPAPAAEATKSAVPAAPAPPAAESRPPSPPSSPAPEIARPEPSEDERVEFERIQNHPVRQRGMDTSPDASVKNYLRGLRGLIDRRLETQEASPENFELRRASELIGEALDAYEQGDLPEATVASEQALSLLHTTEFADLRPIERTPAERPAEAGGKAAPQPDYKRAAREDFERGEETTERIAGEGRAEYKAELLRIIRASKNQDKLHFLSDSKDGEISLAAGTRLGELEKPQSRKGAPFGARKEVAEEPAVTQQELAAVSPESSEGSLSPAEYERASRIWSVGSRETIREHGGWSRREFSSFGRKKWEELDLTTRAAIAHALREDVAPTERPAEPAPPTPTATVGEGGQTAPEAAPPTAKPGDKVRVMGIRDAVARAVKATNEGTIYELFESPSTGEGVLRVTDEETGNVVSLKKWPQYATARAEYEKVPAKTDTKRGTPFGTKQPARPINNVYDRAYELGKIAYAGGVFRSPGLDPELTTIIKTQDYDNIELMKKWTAGWDDANLATEPGGVVGRKSGRGPTERETPPEQEAIGTMETDTLAVEPTGKVPQTSDEWRAGDHAKFVVRDEKTGESENLWLKVSGFDNEANVIYGTLDSEPVTVPGLKLGQQMRVSYDNIIDHQRFEAEQPAEDLTPSATIEAEKEAQDERAESTPSEPERLGEPRAGTLEGAPPEAVLPTETEEPAGRSGAEGRGTDSGRTDRPDREGRTVQPSVGDGEGELAAAPDRDGRTEPRREPGQLSRPGQSTANDYRITDADRLGDGSLKQKYADNVSAIRLLKQLEAEGRKATPQEQSILAKFVGWGGMPQVFDQNNQKFHAEYAELIDLLDDEEYRAARASTPNAHYTSAGVIRGMWEIAKLAGFNGGKVLEPSAGVGNFFGLMPPELAGKVSLNAVELDSVTGRILKQLYQSADVQVRGYETTTFPDNTFDLVITNVPFGNFKLHEPRYNPLKLSIHNHFIVKALDQTRPGGMVMAITSHMTMDAILTGARQEMATRGDLVAAIRLPYTAFKKNANTEVTTDILIFRKREEGKEYGGQPFIQVERAGAKDRATGGNIPLNEYFVKNPSMMLGEMTLQGSMRRDAEPRLDPKEGAAAIEQQIREAVEQDIERVRTEFYSQHEPPKSATVDAEVIPAPDEVKPFGLTVLSGRVYQRIGGQLVPQASYPRTNIPRLERLMKVREAVRKLLAAETEDQADSVLAKLRSQLNKAYDGFVRENGPISLKRNSRLMAEDPDLPLLQALEDFDSKTKTAKKAKIFTQKTVAPRRPVENAETAKEALTVSLNEKGGVDLEHMARLTGKTVEEVETDLLSEGVVFRNPDGGVETTDAYLSGNVRKKLRAAEQAAKKDPHFKANVEALKKVIPADIQPEEIAVRLGSHWLPKEVISDFVGTLLGTRASVSHSTAVGSWKLDMWDRGSVAQTETWGTKRAPAEYLIEDALNLREPTVYDLTDDDRRVVNEKETLAARDKLEQIQNAFKEWVFKDKKRAERLAFLYNEAFNAVRLREYDGSHLTLPGMTAQVQLLPHQQNAIWRVISSGSNVGLFHVVGAGKTFEIVGAAMELRRLGLSKKPMIVVPNHLVEQWGVEFLRLYPGANVLVARKEDFRKGNRQRLMSRIASGDWDAVIVAHRSFEFLPVSDKTFNQFMQEQIDELEQHIREMKRGKEDSRLIKELEKAKARLKAKIAARAKREAKDVTVGFEELGVDSLFVDEAHLFKNLFFTTKMTRVSGVPSTESNRAFDMYIKTQLISRRNNGRGVVFATGTPISNTMAEMFVQMKYLNERGLKDMGLESFDSWAATFGQTVQSFEVSPEDPSRFRMKTRFSKFVNLPELITMFRSVGDVKTAEDLNLPRPNLKGGRAKVVVVQPNDALKAYVKTLGDRADKIRKREVSPEEDNMLKVTGDGRKAALDLRVVDPLAEEDPNGKINVAVQNIHRIWRETEDKRLTQLVMLDLSTPSETKKGGFVAYNVIRDKLIRLGVPKDEIAFIHDADTDEKKLQLFDRVNSGAVRIILGSTEKLGIGTNIQRKLFAIHHLDAPWRPSDIEQRNGRILRRGNENEEVEEYQYITEGTFDAYMWQLLENKSKFIAQAMRGDISVREVEDVDGRSLSYAEAKALATGNPMVAEKVKVDLELRKLQQLKARHEQNRYRQQGELASIPERIEAIEEQIEGVKQDIAARDANPQEEFRVVVQGKAYDERKDAGARINDIVMQESGKNRKKEIGEFRGFTLLVASHEMESAGASLHLVGAKRSYEVSVNPESPLGTILSLEAKVKSFADFLQDRLERAKFLRSELVQLEAELAKPFSQEARLEELRKRATEIEGQLAINKSDANVGEQEETAEEKPREEPEDQEDDDVDTFPAPRGAPFGTRRVAGMESTKLYRDPMELRNQRVAKYGQKDKYADLANVDGAERKLLELEADIDRLSAERQAELRGSFLQREIDYATDSLKRNPGHPIAIRRLAFFKSLDPNVRYEAPLANPLAVVEQPKQPAEVETMPSTVRTGLPPFGRQTPLPETGTGEIRRSEVLADIRKLLDIPFGKGRFKQRALGIFKAFPWAIRTKFKDVLQLDSHELGHAIHVYMWGITSKGRPETKPLRPYSEELEGLVPEDWPATRQTVTEGYAEFVRLFITAPEEAEAQAPEFYEFFTTEVGKDKDLDAALKSAQNKYMQYQAQDEIEKAKADILFDERTRAMPLRELLSLAKDELQDEIAPFARLTKKAYGTKTVEEVATKDNLYVLAEAYLNGQTKGRTQAFLTYGPLRFTADTPEQVWTGTRGMFSILEPLGSLDSEIHKDWAVYRVAHTVLDRLAAYPKMVFPQSKESYEQQIATLDKQHPEFRGILEELRKFKADVIDYVRASGKVSEETLQKIEEVHKYHVPLYRDIQKTATKIVGGRFAKVPGPFKRAKGGTELILHPTVSDVMNMAALINSADRHYVQRALIQMAELPNMADEIEQVDEKKYPVKVNLQSIRHEIEDAAGIDLTDAELEAVGTIWQSERSRDLPENIIEDWSTGKRRLFEVKNQEVLNALRGLTPEESSIAVEMASIMAKTLRAGVTLTADFAIKNMGRDQLVNAIQSERKWVVPYADFAHGIAILSKAKNPKSVARLAVAAGLRHWNITTLDRGTVRQFMQEEMRKKQSGRGYSVILRHPWEAIRYITNDLLTPATKFTEASESITRLPEFQGILKQRLKKGEDVRDSMARAAYAAGRTSVNFNKRGGSRFIRNLIRQAAFFNANLQGAVRFIESHRFHPGRTIRRATILLTLPSLYLYFLNRDDDEYMEFPLWRRMFFWNIPVWKLRGSKTDGINYIMIPKPWEYGFFYATLPEYVLQEVDRQNPEAVQAMADALILGGARQRTEHLPPVTASDIAKTFAESALPDPRPTWVQALWHQVANEDAFGRPIVGEFEKDLEPEYQDKVWTPQLWKRLGQWAGISPARIHQAWRDTTGTIGSYVEDLGSLMDDKISGKERPPAPEKRLADMPFLKSFIAKRPGFNAESVQKFYDELNQMEQAYRTARLPLKGREVDPEVVDKAEREGIMAVSERGEVSPGDKLADYRDAAQYLRDLRSLVTEVQNDPKKSPQQKRQELDRIEAEALRAAREVRGRYQPIPAKPPFGTRQAEARP